MTSVRLLISDEQRQALARLREEAPAPVVEAVSHEELRRQINAALRGAPGLTMDGARSPYVVEVYDDSVIYKIDGAGVEQYYKAPYSVGADDQVTVSPGTPVKKVVSYEPAGAPAAVAIPVAVGEAERDQLSEFTPLIEKAVRGNGLVPIKIIQPGWGSSGFYSADVLKNSTSAFGPGTHMYWNHPTESERKERPERDLRDLAAVTVTPAKYEEAGADGPGLYALSTVVPHYRDHVDGLAEHIGLSINAYGSRHKGEADGRKGWIVDSISEGESIDFVTRPGAGGKIVGLFESARASIGGPPVPTSQGDEMDDQERRELTERAQEAERKLTEAQTALEGERTRRQRAEERVAVLEAGAVISEKLAGSDLPEVTRARLAKSLPAQVTLAEDGSFDREAFGRLVESTVAEERAYIDGLSEAGKVRDQGAGTNAGDATAKEAARKRLVESYVRQGMTEDQAKRAAGL